MKTKYEKIYHDLAEEIVCGKYQAGDRLPEEVKICEKYGCSRMTAKKAYDMLVREGLVYRKKGMGSFVLSGRPDDDLIEIQERKLSGFSSSPKKGTPGSNIIHFKLDFASKFIADRLGIKEKDPIYDILRVRTVDGRPYVLEQTYMAPSVIPGITEDVLKHSVYQYIENTLGLKIGAAQKTTRADKSDALDQEYLNLSPREPVLEIEQTAYLDSGIPFEYSISRHRYDNFKFTLFSLHAGD